MSTEELRARRDHILSIAARHGARNVRLFGSVVRGQAGPDSDVDFLVEMDGDRSLLDHVGLIQDLEDYLGRKVDVVSERALHWFIRDRVLAEAVPL
jgi:predicted nucleotidyltransferase